MADRIKGITVEIGGDTAGLDAQDLRHIFVSFMPPI